MIIANSKFSRCIILYVLRQRCNQAVSRSAMETDIHAKHRFITCYQIQNCFEYEIYINISWTYHQFFNRFMPTGDQYCEVDSDFENVLSMHYGGYPGNESLSPLSCSTCLGRCGEKTLNKKKVRKRSGRLLHFPVEKKS